MEKVKTRDKLSRMARLMLTALSDRPRQLSEVRADLGMLPDEARRALADLRARGLVRQVSHRYWISAEAQLSEADAAVGRAREVLELIDKGENTAPAMRGHLGVSRQRMDQIIQDLLARGLIDHVGTCGVVRVYARAGGATVAPPGEPPSLLYRLLAAMPDEGWVRGSDLIASLEVQTPYFVKTLDRARERGLVEVVQRTTQITTAGIRLTNAGRTDPLRARRPRLQTGGLLKGVDPRSRRVVACMGDGETLRAAEIRRRVDLGQTATGAMMQRLVRKGLLEQLRDPAGGGHPLYRLTRFARIAAHADGLRIAPRETADARAPRAA